MVAKELTWCPRTKKLTDSYVENKVCVNKYVAIYIEVTTLILKLITK